MFKIKSKNMSAHVNGTKKTAKSSPKKKVMGMKVRRGGKVC